MAIGILKLVMFKKWLNPKVLLVVILLIGAFLRFYNLNWDQGYNFHPDERNIAIAISNLNLDQGQLNPKFWAYGSLPIYTIYSIAYVTTKLGIRNLLEFSQYVLIGRFLSALLSTVIIYLTYYIIKQLLKTKKNQEIAALIGAGFVCFLPGMIQFAHFMTFETYLTFMYLLMLIWVMQYLSSAQSKYLYLLALTIGLSIATKITSLVFIPLVSICLAIEFYNQNRRINFLFIFSRKHILSILIIIFVGFIASPYNILDFKGFLGAFNYESNVARGILPVFYTQQFIGTIPVIYQLTKVFPFVLTIPLTILAVITLIYLGFNTLRISFLAIAKSFQINPKVSQLIMLLLITCAYLASNFVMYVKWTRYMIPSLPFLVIIIVLVILKFKTQLQILFKPLTFIILVWTIGAGLSFFTLYLQPDTRLQGAVWATDNLNLHATVTAEIYDLGIVPFNSVFSVQNMTLLNLYDMEYYPDKIWEDLNQSQIFISTSPRIYSTRFRLPNKYPDGYRFYDFVFNAGQWQQVANFDRNLVECNIFTLNCMFNTIKPDETFSVFDHPEIKVFTKLP